MQKTDCLNKDWASWSIFVVFCGMSNCNCGCGTTRYVITKHWIWKSIILPLLHLDNSFSRCATVIANCLFLSRSRSNFFLHCSAVSSTFAWTEFLIVLALNYDNTNLKTKNTKASLKSEIRSYSVMVFYNTVTGWNYTWFHISFFTIILPPSAQQICHIIL